MRRPDLAIPLTALAIAITPVVSETCGQPLSDAQQALQGARRAYDAASFAEARDLAKKASETDPKNPDVYLLLGKAHYQLGEVDDAMTAWNQTLVLAPKESFARQMLEMLRGQRKEVDARIRFVESLVSQRLDPVAGVQCQSLLEADKPLSDAQRAAILMLQAELAVRANQPAEARTLIAKVLSLHPKHADPVRTALILGQAKVRGGGPDLAEGLAGLKQLAEGDSPAAATAQWDLIAFGLGQGIDAGRTAAAAKWLADHARHPQADEAREQLLSAHLALSMQAELPRPETVLNKNDAAALTLADEIIKGSPRSVDRAAVAEKLITHLTTRYASNRAYAAAAEGLRKLLDSPLPQPSRIAVRLSLFAQLKAIALENLRSEARSGRLVTANPAALPADLAAALAVLAAVRHEGPAAAPWSLDVQLAGEVRAVNGGLPWPDQLTSLRAPDAWMLAIALPVLKADADPNSVKAAVAAMHGLIQEYQSSGRPEAWELVLEVDRQLLGAMSPKNPQWPEVLMARVARLDAYAKQQFKRNAEAGLVEKNNQISDVQKELVKELAQLVTYDASRADAAMQQLAEHLRPWIDGDHWPVAEAAFASLKKALPTTSARDAALVMVRLSMERVFRRDQRVLRTGLTVPRKLDPALEQALQQAYVMQAGLPPESPRLQQVRSVWDAVVGHYRGLEYDDIAEEALKLRLPQAVEAADQYAEILAIRFQEEKARRDLAQRLRQYEGTEKIALTPEFKEVLSAWTKWIGDHSTSPLAPQAVEQVLGIGRLFEQYGAFEAAAGVYGDFVKFAAGVKPLAQSVGNQPSVAEAAAALAAGALEKRAEKALAKQMSDRKPDDPPPAKLSDEFAAAIAARKAFLAAHPNSVLSSNILRTIMSVAVEYAKIDAWEVAEGIYADLAASELKIRRPERLDFARGVCRLGRAMPTHAREILVALNAARLGGEEKSEMDSTALATLTAVGRPSARGSVAADGDGSGGGAGFGNGKSGAGGSSFKPGDATTVNARVMALDEAAKTVARADDAKDSPAETRAGVEPATPPPTQAPAGPRPQTEQAKQDSQLLAMIQRQESARSARVAQMGEKHRYVANQSAAQGAQQAVVAAAPMSAAELARQEKSIDAAYKIFQELRQKHADSPTAEQARGEIVVMIGYWRSLSEWERSAALAVRFLADNPRDSQLPQIRLEVAHDRLAWAAKPIGKSLTRQELLAEVGSRFASARAELGKIIAEFVNRRSLQQQAQWELANSFLTEARAVSGVSPTLARGQFVRAARELRAVAVKYPGHPRVREIAQMLWAIAQEMENQGYEDESVLVWNELAISDPMNPLAQQAIGKIAETYRKDLKRPLKAVETYVELNFVRGGSDAAAQQAVYQLGSSLKDEKRWVEALHVLETFVDSFPRHAQAGEALAMIGQIHQTNQAWEDAIKAYRRVIDEYKDGPCVQQAKWSIAECKINLSRWGEAMGAYRDYVSAYPKDSKTAEANRRLDVLKDLARFQGLVDEKGQRKAFDAQFQIATIVRTQLANPVKGIIEYRKVVANWPESYVAATALHEIGKSYSALGETAKAREAFTAVAKDYPTSPLAGASLFEVGKSHEDEADKLATLTRERSMQLAKEEGQRRAYEQVQLNRRNEEVARSERIQGLKSAGKGKLADLEEAAGAFGQQSYNLANASVFARQAQAEVETLSASQLADRQDKINAALRKAIEAYSAAAKLPGSNKADSALLQMANIYDQRLKDSKAAMEAWLEIVRQFSGTAVAQDASWKLAQYYEREGQYAKAIEAYNSFLRNYRGSPNAAGAQFAVAECYEHLGQWVAAMDSYNNYINNFPDGPMIAKAKEQIGWIKTYRM